jgi:hypothetical protein
VVPREVAAASAAELAALGERLFDCSYSCGGACGADALATAPAQWLKLAPVQTGAASILSSCVYFLRHAIGCTALLNSAIAYPVYSFGPDRSICLAASPDSDGEYGPLQVRSL